MNRWVLRNKFWLVALAWCYPIGSVVGCGTGGAIAVGAALSIVGTVADMRWSR